MTPHLTGDLQCKRFWIRTLAAALVVATAGLLSIGQTVALAQDKAPDATFRYSGGSVGIGVGASWGHGTLSFQGKDYPFRMRGMDLVNVGGSKITATADVYNLKNIADSPARTPRALWGRRKSRRGRGSDDESLRAVS